MEGFIVLLVLLVIGALVCGPVALIIAIGAMAKANRHEVMLESKLREEGPGVGVKPGYVTPPVRPVEPAKMPEKITEQDLHREPASIFEKPLSPLPMPAEVKTAAAQAPAEVKPAAAQVREAKEAIAAVKDSLEQRIGTLWVLIAGVVTVIVAVGFFLKYAYENALIPPVGRVLIVAVSGLVALAIGEVTRRRGYDIVAKAVTALGFAILYAADFAAFRTYHLLGAMPAIGLAAVITTGAMAYAVALDEIIMAVISLAGGFLAPLMMSTGENLPHHLFSYCLVLGIGAAFCAFYRRWRAVNALAFLGTFVLYTAWFEKFFRPELSKAGTPEQMGTALGWLGVFFAVYLVLPVLHTLVRKVKALAEDVLLVSANSVVVFYYLWTVLYEDWRAPLALAAVVLGAAHLVMAGVVTLRCREDVNLRAVLLVIGLFFVTIAVPLYFEQDAVVLAWGIEGFVLAVIGCRYRNYLFQLGSGAALVLAIGRLVYNLPMHTGVFEPVFNPAFGTWCFVAAVLILCHLLYRRSEEISPEVARPVSQIFYAAGVGLLTFASALEWYWHCDYNLGLEEWDGIFFRGMLMILAACYLLLIVRPLRPSGPLNPILAGVVAIAGSLYAAIGLMVSYSEGFVIFANLNFAAAVVFIAGLLAAGWMLKRAAKSEAPCALLGACFAFAAIVVLWVIGSEQIYLYWYWKDYDTFHVANWRFLANMWVSVAWAVYGALLMVVGFWKNIRSLRYMALGLFGLLVAKIFIIDMSTVKSIYRITAFLATGLTLVGVSYLYQYLKKQGFFDKMLAEATQGKGAEGLE